MKKPKNNFSELSVVNNNHSSNEFVNIYFYTSMGNLSKHLSTGFLFPLKSQVALTFPGNSNTDVSTNYRNLIIGFLEPLDMEILKSIKKEPGDHPVCVLIKMKTSTVMRNINNEYEISEKTMILSETDKNTSLGIIFDKPIALPPNSEIVFDDERAMTHFKGQLDTFQNLFNFPRISKNFDTFTGKKVDIQKLNGLEHKMPRVQFHFNEILLHLLGALLLLFKLQKKNPSITKDIISVINIVSENSHPILNNKIFKSLELISNSMTDIKNYSVFFLLFYVKNIDSPKSLQTLIKELKIKKKKDRLIIFQVFVVYKVMSEFDKNNISAFDFWESYFQKLSLFAKEILRGKEFGPFRVIYSNAKRIINNEISIKSLNDGSIWAEELQPSKIFFYFLKSFSLEDAIYFKKNYGELNISDNEHLSLITMAGFYEGIHNLRRSNKDNLNAYFLLFDLLMKNSDDFMENLQEEEIVSEKFIRTDEKRLSFIVTEDYSLSFNVKIDLSEIILKNMDNFEIGFINELVNELELNNVIEKIATFNNFVESNLTKNRVTVTFTGTDPDINYSVESLKKYLNKKQNIPYEKLSQSLLEKIYDYA